MTSADGGRPARPRGWRAAALVLVAAVAVTFAPALSPTAQFLARDSGRLHHPMKRWIAERLARGDLPEWNPRSGLGLPVLGNAVDAALHPFTALTLVLPFDAAFKAWVLLSILAAALGAAAWARVLGASPAASLAAGLAYGLSGPLVSSTDNLTFLTAAATLPWVFAAAHRWASRSSPGRLAACALASFLCAAAGDPQAWAFAVLLLAPYVWLAAGDAPAPARRARALLAPLVAAWAALPAVLPVLLWTPHSSRALPLGAIERSLWNLAPARLVELLVPNLLREVNGVVLSPLNVAFSGDAGAMPWLASLYLGATVLALALAGAAWDRRALGLLVVALGFTWIAMGPRAGFGAIADHLPVLSRFRFWEKAFPWAGLCVAMAAGLGLDAVLASPGRARALARASGALAVALLGAAGALAFGRLARALPLAELGAALVPNARLGLAHAGAVCAALAAWGATRARRSPSVAAVLIVALVALDVALANAAAYSLGRAPIASARAPLGDALDRQGGVQRVYTPFALAGDRWTELSPLEGQILWGTRALVDPWQLSTRSVANLDPYVPMPPLRLTTLRNGISSTKLGPVLGFWSVAHVVVPGSPDLAAKTGLAPPFRIEAEDAGMPAFVVAIPHRPRAYVAAEPFSATEPEALTFVLREDPMRTPRTAVEAPVPPEAAGARGEARIAADEPEHVVVEVQSDRRALLVLNDQLAPGWTARVDGAPGEIFAANYLARGVWVPAGAHRVEFRYRTPGLREGAVAALLLAAGLAGWGWRARRSRGP